MTASVSTTTLPNMNAVRETDDRNRKEREMTRQISFRSFIAVLAVLFLLPSMSACKAPEEAEPVPEDASLQTVLDAGQLVLGLDAGFPPMGFTDESGEIVGFDIDVGEEVCNRLGIELVPYPMDWDEKEELLNSGTIDCIWNGMSVTSARAQSMNLSDPYMKNEMIFVVPGASEIRTMSDLSGKTVGVQNGSTAQEMIEASDLYDDLNVILVEDNVTLLKDLSQGNADAAFLDSVFAYYYISKTDGNYFVLPGSLGEEDYAIGFRKGDGTLRNRVQEIIYEMNSDGTLSEISEKWFGSDITSLR